MRPGLDQSPIIDLSNKRLWRVVTWPVLFFTSIFLILYPEWHNAWASIQTHRMGYAPGASRNETGLITGPAGTEVNNVYIPSGDFAGRIATSLTKRDTETLSTATYTYAKGTAGGFTELNSQISNLGFDLNTIWPGYSAAFVEKQFTQTVAQDNRSSSTSYLDALGNTVATMEGNGKWNVSIADAEGRTLFTKSSSGATTRNTYDESGLLTRAENTDSSGTVTVSVTTYDKQGRQTAVSQDGKQSSATDYVTGPFGTRERTSTDASGNKTTTVTDAAGRTVQEIFEGVKGSRRETNYGYDGFGRRSFTISPRGLATLFTYDEAGRETLNAVFAEGRRIDTKKGYDRFGRLQWDQSPLQAEANPPRFKTYLYKVDKPGAGLTPWTTLDDTTGVNDPAYGQLVRVFFEDNDDVPDNNAAYSGYYEEYQYDSKGRQTGVTKPSVVNGSVQAVTTKTDYNSKEQAEYVTFNYVEGGLTSPTQNVRFQFTYDSRGNRETVIYPSGIVKQWSHNYDSQGDLTSLTETQPGGALLKSDSYVGGMVSQTQDGANNRIVNAYNDFQLLTRKYFASGQTDPAFQHEYQYDDDDRLTDINTYVGATDSEVAHYETRKYDPETGSLASVGKSEGTLGYSYDGKGALSAMSYYGRTTNYEYDFFGRISRSESPEGELVYRYNTVGLKASVANVAERTFEEYEYDALGHVEKLTMRNADGAIIHETDYVLGVDGNRIGAIENHTGSPQVVWSYRYDALERLIKEERVGGTSPRNVEYAYDNDGNRIELTDIIEPGKGRIYEYYTDTQRLRYIRDANNAQIVETYHWNNNGQLIEKITSDGTESYFWGLDGTLAQVTLTDGRVVRYDYDHTGTLIARKVFESSTAIAPAEYVRYLVDSENPTSYSQVVAGIDGITGAVKVLNSFTDRIVAQTTFESGNGAGTSTQFLHADALGSIRSLTGKDATGATFSEHYDYTAFGSKMGGATASTTYAYTGQPRDSLTEMQYHRSRWLNANLGQWSSHDPLFDFPDGFGLAYSYVGNNPIGLVDPSGEGQLIDLAVSGAISGFLVGMGIGAAVGIYKAFFTDVYSETSFLGKIVVVLETMLLEAVKGAIGGAILGPLLGILLKPVEALLGMVMGFLKVHIQRGVTPFIQYLGRIFNGTAFETFLRGIQGSLNNLGSIGGMEVFFAKFAELLGAKLPDALARRGILNIGNIVLRGGGRKAQYDLILQGERYIFNFEMKLTRQAIGSYAELTQDFVRKQAVAAANGLTNQKWSMYIWRGGNSDLVIQNIVNALRAAGIQDPLVVQGFWPCVRDLVGKILL